MTLPDDLREAAGGLDRRCKVPRRRRTTLGPVSVEMLIKAADDLERLEDENRKMHSALLAIINTTRDPVTIARETLGETKDIPLCASCGKRKERCDGC